MPASRRCPKCSRIIKAGKRYCTQHEREYEQARGTSTQRGYGVPHKRKRDRWKKRLEAGEPINCAKCKRPIDPAEPWDLGHTEDRTGWTGPEHANCNRSEGGTRGANIVNSR